MISAIIKTSEKIGVKFMKQKQFFDLSGKYSAHGVDRHDGFFEKEVNFKLDSINSDFAKGYAVYEYYSNLEEGTVLYRGSMIASGNHLSLAFKSEAAGQNDDGVATGVVMFDPDADGSIQTILHFFYYQAQYQGGGNGMVTCVMNAES